MISSDTINTWIAEFTRASQKDKTGATAMKLMTELQARLLTQEPLLAAALSTMMGNLNFNNPLSAALFCMSVFRECQQRQSDADNLEEKMGGG